MGIVRVPRLSKSRQRCRGLREVCYGTQATFVTRSRAAEEPPVQTLESTRSLKVVPYTTIAHSAHNCEQYSFDDYKLSKDNSHASRAGEPCPAYLRDV
jgi:hypothetical protein